MKWRYGNRFYFSGVSGCANNMWPNWILKIYISKWKLEFVPFFLLTACVSPTFIFQVAKFILVVLNISVFFFVRYCLQRQKYIDNSFVCSGSISHNWQVEWATAHHSTVLSFLFLAHRLRLLFVAWFAIRLHSNSLNATHFMWKYSKCKFSC